MTRLTAALLATAVLALGACGEEEAEPAGDAEVTTSTTSAPATTSAEPAATGAGENAGEQPQTSGGGESARSPAASAEQAIRAVLTAAGKAAEACTDFVTADFVATAYGGRANCIAARRPNALAESVAITEDGGGTFTAVPKGGPYDGVEVTVEVVDDGGFRVASLLADIPAGP